MARKSDWDIKKAIIEKKEYTSVQSYYVGNHQLVCRSLVLLDNELDSVF